MSKKKLSTAALEASKTAPPVNPGLDQLGADLAALGNITAEYYARLEDRIPFNVAEALTQQLGSSLICLHLPSPPPVIEWTEDE